MKDKATPYPVPQAYNPVNYDISRDVQRANRAAMAQSVVGSAYPRDFSQMAVVPTIDKALNKLSRNQLVGLAPIAAFMTVPTAWMLMKKFARPLFGDAIGGVLERTSSTVPTAAAALGGMVMAKRELSPTSLAPLKNYWDKKPWAHEFRLFHPDAPFEPPPKRQPGEPSRYTFKEASLSAILKQAWDSPYASSWSQTPQDMPGYHQAIMDTWNRPTLGVRTMRDNIWSVPGMSYAQRQSMDNALSGAAGGRQSGLLSFSDLASTIGPSIKGAAIATGIGMLGGLQAPALRAAAAAGALGGFYSGLRKIL